MTADPVDHLSTALDLTGRLVGGVGVGQWAAPTPCAEWDVRAVVGHLVGGNRLFAGILGGMPPAAPPGHASGPEGDLAVAYRDSAGELLAAFRRPGVLEAMWTVPFGTVPGIVALHLRITEVLVHGWDIARATGQETDFPVDLVEQELAFAQSKLGDIPPERRPFAPPRPAPHGALPIERLAACLGRDVTP